MRLSVGILLRQQYVIDFEIVVVVVGIYSSLMNNAVLIGLDFAQITGGAIGKLRIDIQCVT